MDRGPSGDLEPHQRRHRIHRCRHRLGGGFRSVLDCVRRLHRVRRYQSSDRPTDPLLIRHSADEDWTDASPMRAATGLALAVGLAELLPLLVVVPLVGDATGACLLALAVSIPGLLVQDAWRQAFITQARPAAAC